MNLLELAERRGLSFAKASSNKGGEYHGPCPGCGGRDRFHIWPEQKERGTYWCRGCDRAGDLIQFLIDFDGLTYRQACEQLGVEVKTPSAHAAPALPARREPAPRAAAQSPGCPQAPAWTEKATAFAKWATDRLLSASEQLAYLQARGIPQGLAVKCGLGWNPDDLYRPRAAWGLPAEVKKNGRPRKLWIPPGIVIPLFEAGRLQRIRVRRAEGEPRYYVVPGSAMATMTLGDVRRAAVVVESELDGILLHHRAGDIVRVVALGSSAAKPDARATALLREAALILVALDFDKAGAQASPWWKQNFPQSKLWPPPVGKDPGEAYSKHGVDLAAWVRAGFPEGWTVGQALCSPLGLQGVAPPRVKPPPVPVELPEAVERLYAILLTHPGVRIFHTPNQVKLIYPDSWSSAHWEIFSELSQLVYYGAGVLDFIFGHPAKVIDAANLYAFERRV